MGGEMGAIQRSQVERMLLLLLRLLLRLPVAD